MLISRQSVHQSHYSQIYLKSGNLTFSLFIVNDWFWLHSLSFINMMRIRTEIKKSNFYFVCCNCLYLFLLDYFVLRLLKYIGSRFSDSVIQRIPVLLVLINGDNPEIN